MRRRTQVGAVSRVLAAIAIIASLGLMTVRASAQDVSNGYVGVSCAYDPTMDVTWCAFTPSSGDGSAATAIALPLSAVCASVADLGNGSWGADAVVATGDGASLSVALAGQVTVGGTASYAVTTAAGDQNYAGDGLVCGTGGPSETTVDDTPAPDPTNVPADAGGSEGGDVGQAVDTPVVPASDVTPAQQDETAPPTPEQTNVPVDVTVNIVVYHCATDPGGADPALSPDCTLGGAIDFGVTADGVDLGTVTTGSNGLASFSAPDGSALVVTEDVGTLPSGYEPLGSGVAYAVASAGASLTFVNLVEPIVGRLQVVSGSCPTSGDDRIEFRVIEPRTAQAASEAACMATAGTPFTITGGTLGGGLQIVTGGDGAWRGFLPEGTYTVAAASGEAADVRVLVDEISVVVAVEYRSNPLGVLNLSRQVCTDAPASGVDLSASFDAPELGDTCEAVDGQMTVEPVGSVSSADVTTVTLGADGVEEIEVSPGSYLVTDVTSGASTTVDLERSSRLYVVARESIAATGGSGDGSGNPDGNGGGSNAGGDNTGGGTGGNDGGGNSAGNGSGGDGTGGEQAGGGDESGGADAGGAVSGVDDGGTGGVAATGEGTANAYGVTTLPATGAGFSHRGAELPGMLLLAAGALVGAWVIRRRATA